MTGLLHEPLDAAAARHPGRVAVGTGDAALTYPALADRSRRLAGWLAGLGVRRGDRVILASSSGADVPALVYACARAGAVSVPLHPGTAPAVAAHVCADAAPALVLTDVPALRDVARRQGADTRDVPPAGAPLPPHWHQPTVLPVDPACFVYTSGSTAMPKAVVCTHQQMTFVAGAIASRLRYRPDDVVYSPLPLSFDYGLYQIFLCALAGARLRLAGADDAGHRLVGELAGSATVPAATVLPAVPSLAANLVRLLERRPRPLRLRLLTNTGAAMPDVTLARLRQLLPDLRIQLMYGLTECKRATVMGPDEDLARPGACGRALPGTEVFVVDGDGRRLPTGETGEIVVRGPHVMAGYWRRPELTAERFPRADGLFPELRTGDYGRLDGAGYLYFAGRRDDLYKENGFRVSVTEVEAAAQRVAGVRAAVVVPPASGAPGATLLVETDLSPADVLVALRGELDTVKVPARCVVVPRLPLNANGKVERGRLPALAGVPGDG